MCECCTWIIPEFREETLKPGIDPRFPVYLAVIPGCREEMLKPGIIRYLSTNSGIPGGDAETRDNPGKPGILGRYACVIPVTGMLQ